MASRSWPATSMATRAARWLASSCEVRALALGPDDQARGRLDLDLDVEVEGQGEDVEAGAEVGRRGRGPGAHGTQGSAAPRG